MQFNKNIDEYETAITVLQYIGENVDPDDYKFYYNKKTDEVMFKIIELPSTYGIVTLFLATSINHEKYYIIDYSEPNDNIDIEYMITHSADNIVTISSKYISLSIKKEIEKFIIKEKLSDDICISSWSHRENVNIDNVI